MPYYHVRLLLKSSSSYHFESNLTEQDIREFAEQYVKGKVDFKGESIKKNDIREISVRMTDQQSIKYADSFDSGVEDIFRFRRGKNVTRDVMSLQSASREARKSGVRAFSKKVFIVHGRDHKPMRELKSMLSEFGLNPIVLHEQPSGSRTIVEKLEMYSDVGYAFVLLTPDEPLILSYPKKSFMVRDVWKFVKLLPPRARQNVVLEFGYFIGILGRDRVCCLYRGNVELPSDMQGMVYIQFKKSVKERRNEIIKELKAAGYEIKI